MRSYYVYIMGNRSGTLYIGMTNNLERRILEHRAGSGRFTGKYRLVKLLYYEATDDAYSAICREKQLKGWLREKKLALIRTQNRAFKDLARQLFGWRAAQFSVTWRSVGGRRRAKTDPSFVRMTGEGQDDGGGSG